MGANRRLALNGLAATLREAEPGIKVRLVFEDGSEVAGALRGVNSESVDLGEGKKRIELSHVKRLNLEFSSAPKRKRAQR
jgi:hypothetical protein